MTEVQKAIERVARYGFGKANTVRTDDLRVVIDTLEAAFTENDNLRKALAMQNPAPLDEPMSIPS